MLRPGSVEEHRVAHPAVVDDIVAQAQLEIDHRRQRLDSIGVDLAKLFDPAQNVVEFGHQRRDLAVAHRDPRELCDMAHLGNIDRHCGAAIAAGPTGGKHKEPGGAAIVLAAMIRTILILAAALLAGCSLGSGPVVTEADRAAGAETHPQLLGEFGGAYAGEERVYLRNLGSALATEAGLDGQCTFTLVNSDVVNAFAVPGCYIYVTRGLMGIVNSEAELAAVLSHELGHIVARHSQRQQRRSMWRGLGVAAVQLITGSERLTQLAGAAAGLFTLRYSRGQEFEADDLGVRYLHAAGYDPYAAVDMLGALGRQESFMLQTRGRDEARSIPPWARTHPLTEERTARAEATAGDTGVAPDALPENELAYLREVDGLLYGDDPEQGFVIGRAFAHPVMRIAFAAPDGFTLTNSPQAILIEGPDGMRGQFAGGPLGAGGLEGYTAALLRALLGDAPVQAGDVQPAVVNGLPALFTSAVVQGREGAVPVTVAAYGAGASAYHFVVVGGSATPDPVARLFASFRLISAEEAATLRPRVIRTIVAQPGDTLESLAALMAGDNKLAHLLALNGRQPGQRVRPGEPLKVVVYAGR